MFGFCACELGTFFLPASLDNPSSFWHNTLVRWMASCSEKRQPDKAQTEMSVPCPAFCFFKEDDDESAQGRCARNLPQILFGGVRQRAHLVHLRRCGHGDGRPVSGAGRHGGAGDGRRAGRRNFHRVRRLLLCIHAGHGYVRRGPCHGGRCGDLVCRDALALFHPPEHAAAPAPGASDAPAAGDRCHRVLDVFYRCGDGHPDHPLQPPDHALSRRGCAGDLRPGHQHQHLRPVLRLQRRAGGAADHFHELRRASAPCSGWRWCRARRSLFFGRR